MYVLVPLLLQLQHVIWHLSLSAISYTLYTCQQLCLHASRTTHPRPILVPVKPPSSLSAVHIVQEWGDPADRPYLAPYCTCHAVLVWELGHYVSGITVECRCFCLPP